MPGEPIASSRRRGGGRTPPSTRSPCGPEGRTKIVIAVRTSRTEPGRLPDVIKDVPTIVVEFVSEGRRSWMRDYIEKRDEYLALGVVEYWVIDRFARELTVFSKTDEQDKETVVKQDDIYQTPLLPGFELPLARLLAVSVVAVAAVAAFGAVDREIELEGDPQRHRSSREAPVEMRLVGFTEATTSGTAGLFEMHATFQDEFSIRARTCTLKEAQRTVDVPDLPMTRSPSTPALRARFCALTFQPTDCCARTATVLHARFRVAAPRLRPGSRGLAFHSSSRPQRRCRGGTLRRAAPDRRGTAQRGLIRSDLLSCVPSVEATSTTSPCRARPSRR